jgi:glycosyltransferase involved in cell wall biosynthesis
MRVLIVTPSYPNPGNPTEGLFNEQHALALERAGVEVTVLVCKPLLPRPLAHFFPGHRDLACLPEHEQRQGLKVFYARYLHVPRYRLAGTTVASCARSIRRAVQRLSAKSSIDVLHVHSTWPAGLAMRRVAGWLKIPYVVTLHIEDDPRQLGSRIRRDRYLQMAEGAAAIVAVGQPLERFAQQFMPAGVAHRLHTIPNGIDLAGLSGVLGSEPVRGSGWGQIVSVCNLWRSKGIDLNLRALKILEDQGVMWQGYTVVGDGPERPSLERLARELGLAHKVRFTGRLSHHDTLREIARADIFSLPSWQEAFGVVYLEALACGRPAVGCRGQGAGDIIRHEVDGLLVQPGDVNDLAVALQWLLEHREAACEMGRTGQERARDFSWERNAAQYLALYRRILALDSE